VTFGKSVITYSSSFYIFFLKDKKEEKIKICANREIKRNGYIR